MNLVKCSNGHYYDGDKFDACPHCEGSAMIDNGNEYTVPIYPAISGDESDITEPITVSGDNIDDIINDDEKTIGYYSIDTGVEPVVGWLVCIEGIDFGKSFNLKAGKNFIGRNPEINDIVLQGDNSISREKHAIVVYDPKSSTFLVQPGMSSELFYLNDKVVLQTSVINVRDIISVGNAKLMFIPFCGSDFSWEKHNGDEEN